MVHDRKKVPPLVCLQIMNLKVSLKSMLNALNTYFITNICLKLKSLHVRLEDVS